MVTHSSILAWEIPEKRLAVHGVAMSWTRLRDSATTLRAGGGVMGSYGDRRLTFSLLSQVSIILKLMPPWISKESKLRSVHCRDHQDMHASCISQTFSRAVPAAGHTGSLGTYVLSWPRSLISSWRLRTLVRLMILLRGVQAAVISFRDASSTISTSESSRGLFLQRR